MTIACDKKEMASPSVFKFAASLEQVQPKAEFADGSAQLIWSNYDNLAVYSYASTNVAAGKVGSAIAAIDSGVGTANAEFTAPAAMNLADGLNYFYACYPAAEPAFAENNGVVSVNVAAEQTGEFGKYQLCYAAAPASATKAAIYAGTVPSFTSFNPATSVIRVYPKLAASAIETSAILSTLSMTVAGKSIVGDASLSIDNGTLVATAADQNTVSVNLASPITITKTASAYIDIVVIPTSDFSSVSFASDGYQSVEKTAPANGFRAGRRIELNLELEPEQTKTLEFADPATYSTYSYHVDGGTFKAEARLLTVNSDIEWTASTNQTWATANVSGNIITMTLSKSWAVGPRKFTVTITPTDPAYASLAKSVTMAQGGQTWYNAADLTNGNLVFNDDGSVTITNTDPSKITTVTSNATDLRFGNFTWTFRDVDIDDASKVYIDNGWVGGSLVRLEYGTNVKKYYCNLPGDWNRDFWMNTASYPTTSNLQTLRLMFTGNAAGYHSAVWVNGTQAVDVWNSTTLSWSGTRYSVGLSGVGTLTVVSFQQERW